MSTNRTIKRELPVKLSDHELNLFGGYIAEKHKEKGRLKDQLKRVVAEYKGQLLKLEEDINRLAEARVKGEETRPVMCEERWHSGAIQVVRLDSGEVIDARPATLADAQETLPIDGTTDLTHLDGKPAKVIEMTVHQGRTVESSVGDTVYVTDDEGEMDVEVDAEDLTADDLEYSPVVDADAERDLVDGLDAHGNVVDNNDQDPDGLGSSPADEADDVPAMSLSEALEPDPELEDAYEARKAAEASDAEEIAAYDAAVPAKPRKGGKGGGAKKTSDKPRRGR